MWYYPKMEAWDTIVFLIIAVILYLFLYLKKTYDFFDSRNIPYMKPNWIFGNMTKAVLMRNWVFLAYADLYKKLEGYKFAGFFTMQKPSVLIRDPELVKDVLIKDFAYFHDRGITINTEVEPITNFLFSMQGEEWKYLRVKLAGAFASGKIKTMLSQFQKIGEILDSTLAGLTCHEKCIDVVDLCERFSTDTFVTCIFGININSLENPDSEFYYMGKRAAEFRIQRAIRSWWPGIPSMLIKLFKITLFHERFHTFYSQLVENRIEYRQENGISGSDFFDVLISLKNNSDMEKSQKQTISKIDVTIDLMAAQCFFFFSTGSKSPSTVLICALFELARHEKIQDKVREEIKTVLKNHDNELTHEALNQMVYTDMVIAETMRKYPPTGMLIRKCKQNYSVRNTDAVIPENTAIVVSVTGLHNDEMYFEKPDEFYPEHFTEEAKSKRPQYAYLPFGEGPRACIAKHFAKMQVKIGLIYMIQNYSYQVSPKLKFPFRLQSNFGIAIEKDIWLKCSKI